MIMTNISCLISHSFGVMIDQFGPQNGIFFLFCNYFFVSMRLSPNFQTTRGCDCHNLCEE